MEQEQLARPPAPTSPACGHPSLGDLLADSPCYSYTVPTMPPLSPPPPPIYDGPPAGGAQAREPEPLTEQAEPCTPHEGSHLAASMPASPCPTRSATKVDAAPRDAGAAASAHSSSLPASSPPASPPPPTSPLSDVPSKGSPNCYYPNSPGHDGHLNDGYLTSPGDCTYSPLPPACHRAAADSRDQGDLPGQLFTNPVFKTR